MDPHHRSSDVIWVQVLNFVTLNSSMPMFCMGDLNEIMHDNEKLGPTSTDFNLSILYVRMLSNLVLFILAIMALLTPGLINDFLLFQLMQGLIDIWAMQNGVCPSPPRPFTTFQ